MGRPVLYVLAGVDGAGKSSIGGHLLTRAGLSWFNPDTYARELKAAVGCDQTEANALAWQEGLRRLDQALANGESHAFETTLGGNTIPARIASAATTHDIMIWFCGLATPELHIARVRARVRAGGHDIPEDKIRERCIASIENLIALLPRITRLQVYDNSIQAEPGDPVPDPVLLAEIIDGRLTYPTAPATLLATPDWAKPILEAALSGDDGLP